MRKVQEARRLSLAEEITEHIREDALEEALDRLYEFIANDLDVSGLDVDRIELLDEINSHMGAVTGSERNVRKGMISKEDGQVEGRRITAAIQNIVGQVDRRRRALQAS